VGKQFAYRLLLEVEHVPRALAALAELAAPNQPGGSTLLLPGGRRLDLPFSKDAATVEQAWDPGGWLSLDAVLWFPLDEALAAYLEDEPEELVRARAEGGASVGYVYLYAHPSSDIVGSLAELELVAAVSRMSDLFHDSVVFRARLATVLERCGARAGMLDLEHGDLLVFWLSGQRIEEPAFVAQLECSGWDAFEGAVRRALEERAPSHPLP